MGLPGVLGRRRRGCVSTAGLYLHAMETAMMLRKIHSLVATAALCLIAGAAQAQVPHYGPNVSHEQAR